MQTNKPAALLAGSVLVRKGNFMFDRLETIEERYDELMRLMSQPDVATNPNPAAPIRAGAVKFE